MIERQTDKQTENYQKTVKQKTVTEEDDLKREAVPGGETTKKPG